MRHNAVIFVQRVFIFASARYLGILAIWDHLNQFEEPSSLEAGLFPIYLVLRYSPVGF